MARARLLWGVLALLWCAAWCQQACVRLAPVWVKKTVTLRLDGVGTARFVFSAAQPDNEVLYTMRALNAPAMQATPARYVDASDDSAYRDYRRARVLALWWYGTLALLGPLGWVLWRALAGWWPPGAHRAALQVQPQPQDPRPQPATGEPR